MRFLKDCTAALMFVIGLLFSFVDLVFYTIHRMLHRIRYTLYMRAAKLFGMESSQIAILYLLRRNNV